MVDVKQFAKELRCGNWVKKIDAMYNGQNPVIFIDRYYQITHNDIYHIFEDEDPTNHPVLLTPVILENLGFNFNGNTWKDSDKEIELVFSKEENAFMQVIHGEYQEGKPLMFLHEIQNRYFSFTGKELSFNVIF